MYPRNNRKASVTEVEGTRSGRQGQTSKKLIEDQVKQGLTGNYKDFRFLN